MPLYTRIRVRSLTFDQEGQPSAASVDVIDVSFVTDDHQFGLDQSGDLHVRGEISRVATAGLSPAAASVPLVAGAADALDEGQGRR